MTSVEITYWSDKALMAHYESAFLDAVVTATERIRVAAPVDTGKMAAGITSRPITPTTAAVYLPFPAYYVIAGTNPHEIRPRGNYPLHFFWPKVGSEVWFAKVNHPGTDPNPFHAETVRDFPAIYAEAAR